MVHLGLSHFYVDQIQTCLGKQLGSLLVELYPQHKEMIVMLIRLCLRQYFRATKMARRVIAFAVEI